MYVPTEYSNVLKYEEQLLLVFLFILLASLASNELNL